MSRSGRPSNGTGRLHGSRNGLGRIGGHSAVQPGSASLEDRRRDHSGPYTVGPAGCCGAQHRTGKALRRQSDRQSRSEEHTSELQSLMRISYAVFCVKKELKTTPHNSNHPRHTTILTTHTSYTSLSTTQTKH